MTDTMHTIMRILRFSSGLNHSEQKEFLMFVLLMEEKDIQNILMVLRHEPTSARVLLENVRSKRAAIQSHDAVTLKRIFNREVHEIT